MPAALCMTSQSLETGGQSSYFHILQLYPKSNTGTSGVLTNNFKIKTV